MDSAPIPARFERTALHPEPSLLRSAIFRPGVYSSKELAALELATLSPATDRERCRRASRSMPDRFVAPIRKADSLNLFEGHIKRFTDFEQPLRDLVSHLGMILAS